MNWQPFKMWSEPDEVGPRAIYGVLLIEIDRDNTRGGRSARQE